MAAQGDDTNGVGRVVGTHAVSAALRAGKRSVEKVYTVADGWNPAVRGIINLARQQGIPVKAVDRRALANLAGTTAHQGIVAQVAEVRYVEVEDLLAEAQRRKEPPFFLVLDGIEDPRNFGALLRTAEASGAHGVVIAKDRSVGVSVAVAKAAAGALEYMQVARVTNIPRVLGILKRRGLWIYGADVGKGRVPIEVDLAVPLALVVGGEGRGLRSLVRGSCDLLISLPMVGRVESLNVSVAGGVIMYEVLRQRMSREKISEK